MRGDVRAAIGAAATRTGVDFSYLLAQAKTESGLDPNAKAASSSATGLYQFLDQSWLAIVKRHGSEHGMGWAADAIHARSGGGFTVDADARDAVMALRKQAGPAALMAASFASDNAQGLGRTLGRAATSTDLYFAHFLGLQGATRFLQAADAQPEASAAAAFPREARANRSIFYDKAGEARSFSAVYALMGRKLGVSDDAAPPVAPGTILPDPPVSDAALRVADNDGPDASAGDDVAAQLASLAQSRVDVLRPTPAQARFAYLMLSMPMV